MLRFLLIVSLLVVSQRQAVAQATATLRVDRAEYSSEVHPGLRPSCLRCAAMESRFRGFSGNILVPPSGDLLMTRSWMLNANARNALVLGNYSDNAEIGLEELLAAPNKITVIHDIPDTADRVRKIHQTNANKIQLQALLQLNSATPNIFAFANHIVDLKSVPGNVADSVKQILVGIPRDHLAIIMAHVNDGELQFHDGSSLSIRGLTTSGKAFVVGCNTLRNYRNNPLSELMLAFGRTLTYDEAAISIQLMLHQFKFKGSYRDALLLLQNEPPTADTVKLLRDRRIDYSSPEKVDKPTEKQMEENERRIAIPPAMGIVKTGVIGISIADTEGEFLLSTVTLSKRLTVAQK